MLTLEYDKGTNTPKLHIRNPFAVAWIGSYRRLKTDLYERTFYHVNERHNWRMWN